MSDPTDRREPFVTPALADLQRADNARVTAADWAAPRCSRGWADRCQNGRGLRCRCACGGHNHGRSNPTSAVQLVARRRRRQFDMFDPAAIAAGAVTLSP